jgi:uncharacterized MAPEG superfamily protein
MPPSEDPLTAAWMFAVLVNSLKLLGIAQLTGLIRVLTGSFAAKEDYELMRATYGPPPKDLIEPFGTPVLRRTYAIHRNDQESAMVFFVLSYAYVLTAPPLLEARALLSIFTLARLAHTCFYALGITTLRSISWGVSTQAMLIMAGRLAAWLLPAAAVGLQVAINAPLAIQWIVSCGVLGTVYEQRRRFDRIERIEARRLRREEKEEAGESASGLSESDDD